MTRNAFYYSTAWRKLSKAFLRSKHYICERCGESADVAHHKTHLNASNIMNPAVSLNPDLLEALCMNCHNVEHFGVGGAVLEGLEFDANGNLVRKQESVCDELYQRVQ